MMINVLFPVKGQGRSCYYLCLTVIIGAKNNKIKGFIKIIVLIIFINRSPGSNRLFISLSICLHWESFLRWSQLNI